jgi:hypothetical protein
MRLSQSPLLASTARDVPTTLGLVSEAPLHPEGTAAARG